MAFLKRGRPTVKRRVDRSAKKSFFVEPIRDAADVLKLKNYLRSVSLRNYAFFCVGAYTNLRVSDILLLRDEMAQMVVADSTYEPRIVEKKTQKVRIMHFSPTARAALREYLESSEYKALERFEDRVFTRVDGGEWTQKATSVLFKKWCSKAGLAPGNYATHTMRKTWIYHHYVNGAPLSRLAKMANHSSERQTLQYIGVVPDEERKEFELEYY